MARTPQKPAIKEKHQSSTQRTSVKRRGLIVSVLVIIAATWFAYHDTLDHSFHFDDTHAIVNNEGITHFDTFHDLPYWLNLNNRPLSYYTFALNYGQGELDPTPYHITNILIHILSSLLLFFVVLKLFQTARMQKSRISQYALLTALFTALIFSLHPVQTQSVTYIVQRMTAMSGMFSLAALLFYLTGRIAHLHQKKRVRFLTWYFLSFLAWIGGLLCKQEAAALPLILLAVEYIFITRKNGKPYTTYLLSALVLVAAVAVTAILTGMVTPEKGSAPVSLYLATQMEVILKYIQLAILPLDLTLDYAFPLAHSAYDPLVLVSAAIHLLIIVMAFLLRKRSPLVSFGIFLFYLALAVTSSVLPIRDVIFEHRLYLSMGGFALILSSLFFSVYAARPRKWLLAIPVLYLVLMGSAAFNRNKDWQDTCTLWEDALQKSPANTRAWLAVGDCLKQRGDLANALDHYNESIRLDSLNPTALNNRGNLKLTMDDFKGSISDYTTIINTTPEYRNLALLNRGIAYMRIGDHIRAVGDFTRAIQSGEAETNVYFHRGLSYVYLGDYPSALEDLKLVVEREPSNKDALFNLASALMNTDKFAEAINYYTQLLTYHPTHLNALHYRGVAYLSLNRRAEACADWQKAAASQHQISAQLLQKYCQ